MNEHAAKLGTVRLRPAVHVAPTDQGLLFRGWDTSMVVGGSEALRRLWAALERPLARGVEVEALMARLPEPASRVAAELLTQLDRAGMLIGAGQDGPAVPAPLRERFGRTLAYLESLAPDPAAAFLRFREAAIAVHGGGPVAGAAARTLLDLGLGRLRMPGAGEAVREHAREAGAILAADTGGDVVVTTADGRGAALEPPSDAAWVPAVVAGGAALVGPASRPGAPADGRDALARVRARAPWLFDEPYSPVVATLAGGLAALEAFRLAAGLPLELDGRVAVVRRRHLESSLHPVVTTRPEQAAPAPEHAGEIDAVAFEQATAALVDDFTGALAAPAPGSLPQAPLATARCAAGAGSGDALAWGHDGEQARRRALGEALRRRTAAAGDALEVGVGRSVVSALADAQERLAARAWIEGGTRRVAFTAPRVAGGDDLDAGAARWLRLLERHHGGDVTVRLAEVTATAIAEVTATAIAEVTATAIAEVTVGGRVTAVGAGPAPGVAAARGLAHAVAALQLAAAGEELGPLPLPWLPFEADSGRASAFLERAAALAGGRVRHEVPAGDPALTGAGLVPVVLTGGRP